MPRQSPLIAPFLHPQAINATAADADREQLFVGLPSGEVKLYDLTSGR